MARGDCRLGTWQVLLTISMVIIPLSAHGRHSLTRRTHHHHNNHSSSDNMEVLTAKMALSEDSAERDHLIGAGGGGLGLALGAKLPLSSSTKRHHAHKQHARLDFVDEDPPLGEELTAGGAGPDQPGNPLSDDVINVEFHSPPPDTAPQDVALDWAKAPQPQPQKQKAGGDPTAWTLSDFYDYLSPDDDLSAVDVTPEPEPSPSAPADMEDENPLLAGSPAPTDKVKPDVDMVGQTSPPAPPMQRPGNGDELSLSGAMGADGCRLGYVRSGPGVCVSQCDVEANFCFNGGVCTVVAGMGAFCRCNVQEYIWNKGTRCDWAVTEFQVLCVVVGVASTVLILLLMIVIFFAKRLHRLKNENKRLRKRSKYRPHSSEPQTDGLSVSTTADGSQPNVRKLCDTPPPAPQAHTHNLAYYDNIISQDEPHKKQQDPGKCPLAKEEGSMNILNSHSPKHENNRPTSMGHDLGGHTPNNTTEENAEDGVTIGLEVLLPKDAKRQVDTSPPLQYDLFLYKVGNNGDYTSPGQAPPTQNANSYPSSHPLPKSPKTPKSPKSPKVHKSPRHTTEKHSGSNREASSSGRHSSPGRHPMSGKHSSPGRRPSPNRHPSLNHNHSPGHHPSPNRHPSPSRHPSTNRHASPGRHPSPGRHRSPSRHSVVPGYKCQPNPSSSTTTPPQLRRPRGRSQPPGSEHSGAGADYQSAHNMRPSPSSPHLTQPPPSPSRLKYSPVSTRSLPQLS